MYIIHFCIGFARDIERVTLHNISLLGNPSLFMNIALKNIAESDVTCSNCQACCCRMEVMIISDTGVPDKHISVDKWGGETMLRLDDGWCSAVNRDTFLCTIYENRPWICREFEMGSDECREEFNVIR
ncbi:YkgJ family cysteine cluster protein [Marinomonas sp. UCMA 3892]|uniref:YkgJ family cysteine cluster protein n=1 Tax=Marinomonas sp. UCMA 3892 TaxID=1972585 RepID=UPI0032B7E284